MSGQRFAQCAIDKLIVRRIHSRGHGAMAAPCRESQNLIHIPTHHRNGLFQNKTAAKMEFATDTLAERGGFEQSVRQRVPDRGSGPL